MDKSTMNRNLQPLLKAGLLSVGDKKLVALTPAGAAKLKQGYRPWLRTQALMTKRLGEDGAAALISAVSRIRKEARHERD
jgi:DNA-binding MarR family transcriptional regulator